MSEMRAGIISLHTSPLTQPGSGDSGGMNVYIREFVSSLTQAGVECDVYVRRWSDELDAVVEVEPGFRVIHVPAGPPGLSKEQLPTVVDDFTSWLREWLVDNPVDVLHANYWLSGVVGHQLKHPLELPLVTTFHTLARVKAETGDDEPGRRIDAEAQVVACSDVLVANATEERRQLIELYHADPDRIEIVAPGVDRALFAPGPKHGAREAIGYDGGPLVLFVGRIQPLKGVDVAVGALAELEDETVSLMIVGGASGADGEHEVARIRDMIAGLGLEERVVFVPPQPHYALSTYYRASDLVVMPSRSESFGLVALEAAACGRPVVAAAVGGLRTLVEDGVSGYLIDDRDPVSYARAIERVLDDPIHAAALGAAGAVSAGRYPWSGLAARLRAIYRELVDERVLVDCT